MDSTAFAALASGRRRGPVASLMRTVLHAAEPAYAAAANWNGRRRAARMQTLTVPVVSVGNLTCGGTGKTPVVAWIAQELLAAGRSPGLLSRGYASLDDVAEGVAGDGAAGGNDEKRVLDALCPGVPHRQARDRVGAGRTLAADGCDAIVVDDGFQYRQLHRDLDLVLIDATQPWGFGHCLPRGLLRERPAALQRADVVLINRADAIDAAAIEQLQSEIRQHTDAAIVTGRVCPVGLVDAAGNTAPLSKLSPAALPFCGLGNPGGFAQTLRSLGVTREPIARPDHHHYTRDDLARLSIAAADAGADQLVCTRKDIVKLTATRLEGRPIWAVDIAFRPDGETLRDRVLDAVAGTAATTDRPSRAA